MAKEVASIAALSDAGTQSDVASPPRTTEIEAMFSGKAVRWSDLGGKTQLLLDDSDTSDSDFEPTWDSIMSSRVLTMRLFKALSSGHFFEILVTIFAHLNPAPGDCFSWSEMVNEIGVDLFPYHPHYLLVIGGSVDPDSDRVALYLRRHWNTLRPRQVLITRQTMGRICMQLLHFWQLDDTGLTWVHRGSARYLAPPGQHWEKVEIQPTNTR